jgi:hypothetical protein
MTLSLDMVMHKGDRESSFVNINASYIWRISLFFSFPPYFDRYWNFQMSRLRRRHYKNNTAASVQMM